MNKILVILLVGLFFFGCDKEKITISDEQGTTIAKLLIGLDPTPTQNSPLHIQGASIHQTLVAVTNTGIVTSSGYTRIIPDTVLQDIDPSAAEWFSSNSSIAQSSQGIISPQGPGSAYVWAKYQNTLSDSVLVDVRILKLSFVAKPDTLVMSTDNSQSSSSTLRAKYSRQIQARIMTTGMIQTRKDTVLIDVHSSSAEWHSSNTAVVQASQGMFISHAPGLSYVWAKYQNTNSDSLLISVRAPETAPSLTVDLPDASLIFRDTIVISGTVQKYALLRIDELTTGYAQSNISSNVDGTFQVTIPDLVAGLRIFSITAQNPTRSDLKTTLLKLVLYYSYGSAGADSITGQWIGECEGRPINFYVSKNQILSRYDITGVLDIQFMSYGVVQGINLIGAVNSDGSMNLTASKSYQGITVSGALSGQFHTTGKADGSVSTEISSSLLPTVTATATWWALKQ
jgi:hypothetical protein